jgi:hypothetical protein
MKSSEEGPITLVLDGHYPNMRNIKITDNIHVNIVHSVSTATLHS